MNQDDADNKLEDDWVTRLRGPDAIRDAAIEELRNILVRGLGKLIASRSTGGLQTEDIAQEALLKILDSLDSFAGRSRFTTWAMTVATRIGISELRRKRYKDISLDGLQASDNLRVELAVDDSSSPSDGSDKKRVLETLKQLIEDELTAKQRAAVQGLLSGLPVEEIAHRTGSNRNAVYKLIHDARVRLKSGFEQAGMMAEDISEVLA